MEEIESEHGKADGTPIKDIKVRFISYDGTTPAISKLDGSVHRPGQTVPVF